MRKAPAGHYYNHQSWEKSRNVVRYMSRSQIQNLKNAIAGYQRILKLTQAGADEIVHRTRLDRNPDNQMCLPCIPQDRRLTPASCLDSVVW